MYFLPNSLFSPHIVYIRRWPGFPALQEKPQHVQFSLSQTELNLCLFPAPSVRLNKISTMVPDEPDLLRHVTQLDVRDNRLADLDASVFPRLEVLHCERNCIVSLKVKGCLLKGIYASSNGGCSMQDIILHHYITTVSLLLHALFAPSLSSLLFTF